ncbi:hypothetical protein NQ318_020764 [Aromia moschata]|uniref:Uncharacterized protein n=1 Tax=Aromia moschata TaxID=1265417 RepID=A0AAV8Y9S0_9CUCU|nr:hypothetical protein NQ318_020764 [Aromia moschata]
MEIEEDKQTNKRYPTTIIGMIAIPIEAKIRVQFNLAISPNEKITLMKTIPEALHPIFWIEEGPMGPNKKRIF